MKFTKVAVVSVFASALLALAGCTAESEEAPETTIDPSVGEVADGTDNVDINYSVESGSCTTPFGAFKGSISGYYGCTKRPPAPYSGPTCFGAAPTGAECANWCKNTCNYTGIPSLAFGTLSSTNNTKTWRCGCR